MAPETVLFEHNLAHNLMGCKWKRISLSPCSFESLRGLEGKQEKLTEAAGPLSL